jgi:hypothetical protein
MARKKPIISPLGQWAYPGEVTVIPSSNITMKGVKYPVLGIDDLGNQQMMMPGGEYDFPGNYVTEYPQMQFGGMSKRKIDKILNENKDLNFVQRMYQPNTPSIMIPGQQYPATHFMESGDGRVYPTVVQMPDGNLQYLGDNAYDYANQSGQYIEFPNDRQARRFAKSYKKGTGVLEEFGKGGWLDQYQVGGVRRPIYTSNPRDPRIGRYTDSLNLYNKNTLAAYNKLKEYKNNIGLYTITNRPNSDVEYAPYHISIGSTSGGRNNFYNFSGASLPNNINRKIRPIGYQEVSRNQDESVYFPVYKKPVQPIIYKKPVIPKVVVPSPSIPPPIVPIV